MTRPSILTRDWNDDTGSRMLLDYLEPVARAVPRLLNKDDLLELDRIGVPPDARLSSGVQMAVRAAVVAALLEQLLELEQDYEHPTMPPSPDDDERRARRERQRDRLRLLTTRTGGHPLERAALDGLRELVANGGGVLRNLVGGAAVDDSSAHDSPSVGRHEGGSSTVDGAAALDTPPADGPTVGAPTDTPAALSSAAGVSVDQGADLDRLMDAVRGPLVTDPAERAQLLARDIRDVTSRQMLSTDGLAAALVEIGW